MPNLTPENIVYSLCLIGFIIIIIGHVILWFSQKNDVKLSDITRAGRDYFTNPEKYYKKESVKLSNKFIYFGLALILSGLAYMLFNIINK